MSAVWLNCMASGLLHLYTKSKKKKLHHTETPTHIYRQKHTPKILANITRVQCACVFNPDLWTWRFLTNFNTDYFCKLQSKLDLPPFNPLPWPRKSSIIITWLTWRLHLFSLLLTIMQSKFVSHVLLTPSPTRWLNLWEKTEIRTGACTFRLLP